MSNSKLWAYRSLLGVTLTGMWYSYRQIINKLYLQQYNLHLEDHEVNDQKKYGQTSINKTVVTASNWIHFFDKSKKTIIVYGDGLSGLVQLAYLHSLDKYNLVLISESANLSEDQELCPPVLTKPLNNQPNLGQNKDWSIWDSTFPCLQHNIYYKYLAKSEEVIDQNLDKKIVENYEVLESLSRRYNVDLEPKMYKNDNEKIAKIFNDTEKNIYSVFNVKCFMAKLEANLMMEEINPLVLKNEPIIRPIFSNDQTYKFRGILTQSGIILADYFIVASEDQTYQKTRYLGQRQPINTSYYYFGSQEKSEFYGDNDELKIGRILYTSTGGKFKELQDRKKYIDEPVDHKPVIGYSKYSNNLLFNFGYGAWQNGLVFWGASKVAELIDDNKEDAKEDLQYSLKRFFSL